jgi:glyoxylase-like metal-dependent hydrolase (beta-lactamase superfamily II)
MTYPPQICDYFDEATSTVTYLVSDPDTGEAAIIDPVLNYDHRSGKLGTRAAEAVIAEARSLGLKVVWVLETHAHADHLTAASFIKSQTGAQIAIGEHIGKVQATFRSIFNLDDVSTTGAEFDRLLKDGETFMLGALEVSVLHTPGHTPACVSYKIGDAVFVGDTVFMPDYGTARADFPGGDAATLYRSIQRILSLPPETRLFMCHDYKAPGRDQYRWQSSVAEERAHNIHIHDGIGEAEFVSSREMRDATLAAPVLLLPSIQVNIRAGRLPKPEGNGSRYLKIPMRLGLALTKSVG